jgi:hypothetical protein
MTAQTDPTPNSRRSPMEHERDLPDAAQTDAPERIWALQFDEPRDANTLGVWGAVNGLEKTQRTAYVRADLHDAAQAEIAKLRAALMDIAEGEGVRGINPTADLLWAMEHAALATVTP